MPLIDISHFTGQIVTQKSHDRTHHMADISRVTTRDGLKPKAGNAPYFRALMKGVAVGYRPSVDSTLGTWIARIQDEKRHTKSLGDFGHLPAGDRFDAAKKETEAFAVLVRSGGIRTDDLETVADACRAYLRDKPDRNRIAAGVFRRHVFSDPIANVKLDKLRRRDLREWRNRLTATPALVSRNKGGETRVRERAASTINRDMTPLRAALGAVLAAGAPNTDGAWQDALKPIKSAGRQRNAYLTVDERKALIDHVSQECRPFVHALCLLPMRAGTIAKMVCGEFNNKNRTLVVSRDAKTGRSRSVVIPDATAHFLHTHTQSKPATAHVFVRDNGMAWCKDSWKRPIKDAAQRAGLPSTTTAYTLRHCLITDMITAGLPILTAAQISGTSVAMIERHYGHLVGDSAEKALAGLAAGLCD